MAFAKLQTCPSEDHKEHKVYTKNTKKFMSFKLHAPFSPAGDQPQAIQQLTEGILHGEKYQTLLGVTGSGKTYTIANVIQNVQRPVLVITHNKTLVAQLYGEFHQLLPARGLYAGK